MNEIKVEIINMVSEIENETILNFIKAIIADCYSDYLQENIQS